MEEYILKPANREPPQRPTPTGYPCGRVPPGPDAVDNAATDRELPAKFKPYQGNNCKSCQNARGGSINV